MTDEKFPFQLSDDEWKAKLSDMEYAVLREKGTERPYTGEYNLHFENGSYACKGCGTELFDSSSKFDHGCGWPSFDKEIEEGKIKEVRDLSHGMIRTEIVCANCGGHLGHVFIGERLTEKNTRHCVNSLSMKFIPASE